MDGEWGGQIHRWTKRAQETGPPPIRPAPVSRLTRSPRPNESWRYERRGRNPVTGERTPVSGKETPRPARHRQERRVTADVLPGAKENSSHHAPAVGLRRWRLLN